MNPTQVKTEPLDASVARAPLPPAPFEILAARTYIEQKLEQVQKYINAQQVQRTKESIVKQVFDNAINFACNLLPLENFLGLLKKTHNSYAELKQIFKTELFPTTLEDFFANKNIINSGGIMDSCVANLGLQEHCPSVQIVKCYSILVAYGLFSYVTNLADPTLFYTALQIDLPYTTSKIIKAVLGDGVRVVDHKMACHNCQNPIFGKRFNLDQMATLNYCVQCAKRMEKLHLNSQDCSFTVIKEFLPNEISVPVDDLHILPVSKIDNNPEDKNSEIVAWGSWEDIKGEDIKGEEAPEREIFENFLKKRSLGRPYTHTKKLRRSYKNSSRKLKTSQVGVVDSTVYFQRSIGEVTEELDEFEKEDETLRNRWNDRWHVQIQKLQQKADLPEVRIALLSQSGAGKSSLLNAIIGKRILPSDGTSEACSSAVVEICYWHHEYYEVEITFLKEAEWKAEQDYLVDEVNDSEQPTYTPAYKILKKIYGPNLPKQTGPEFKAFLEKFPAYIAVHLGKSKKFQLKTPDAVRQVLSHFTTEEIDKEVHMWPLLKKVDVRGPFKDLDSGVHFVDLPGTNDTCAARVKLTKEYIKDCQFIWILSDIGRSATDETSKKLMNDHFLTTLAHNKMWKSICYIATKSDIQNKQEIITKFRLAKDSDSLACAKARNKFAKDTIKKDLIHDIEAKMQEIYAGNERMNEEMHMAKEIPVYTVSSLNYMQLTGEIEIDKEMIDSITYKDINDTEIPKLQNLVHTCTEARSSKFLKILKELYQLLESILQEMSVSLDEPTRARIKEEHKKNLRKLIVQNRVATDFKQAAGTVLDTTIKAEVPTLIAKYKSKQLISEITDPWTKPDLRYVTLKAICVRDGVFKESNFNYNIGRKLQHWMIPLWDQYFKQLSEEIAAAKRYYFELLETFHHEMNELLICEGAVAPEAKNNFMAELLNQNLLAEIELVNKNLIREKRHCSDLVERCVQESMEKYYELAREERGPGARQRMSNKLISGLQGKGTVMLDTHDKILDDMQRITEDISSSLKKISTQVYKELGFHYKVYWSIFEEKEPFEQLVKEIKSKHEKREAKLMEVLMREERQRQELNEKRLYFQHALFAGKRDRQARNMDYHYTTSVSTPIDDILISPDNTPEPLHSQNYHAQPSSRISSVNANLWSVDDVVEWISTTNLAKYAECFQKEKIEGACLLDMTNDLLVELGIPTMGERHSLLRLIRALPR